MGNDGIGASMEVKMVSWWTNLDIEIVCNHGEELSYIQICSLDDALVVFACPVCGQKYKVELSIELI